MAIVAVGTRASISGCTMTAPAEVRSRADGITAVIEKAHLVRPRRLQRRNTGEVLVTTGAIPPAAIAMSASACGAFRAKKRVSPIEHRINLSVLQSRHPVRFHAPTLYPIILALALQYEVC